MLLKISSLKPESLWIQDHLSDRYPAILCTYIGSGVNSCFIWYDILLSSVRELLHKGGLTFREINSLWQQRLLERQPLLPFGTEFLIGANRLMQTNQGASYMTFGYYSFSLEPNIIYIGSCSVLVLMIFCFGAGN